MRSTFTRWSFAIAIPVAVFVCMGLPLGPSLAWATPPDPAAKALPHGLALPGPGQSSAGNVSPTPSAPELGRTSKARRSPKPGGGVAPDTPDKRQQALSRLYATLSKAKNSTQAAPIVAAIERLWLHSGSPTTDLLMARAARAIETGNSKAAFRFVNTVVKLQPYYPEGWTRRAYLLLRRGEPQRALADLRRVLRLNPNHFKALQGVGGILLRNGQKKAALETFRKLLLLHPQAVDAARMVKELAPAVEGQPI